MSMAAPLSRALAERAVGFDPQTLTPAALSAAKRSIADVIAVMLSGSREPASVRLRAVQGVGEADSGHAAGGEGALLVGTAARTSALDAALVNGTSAHAEDFDDFNEAFGGHPTVAVLPAALALAETLEGGASGRALIDAYVVGVELESRLADAVHQHHYEAGWHPTATLGVFGAAAAAARLLGLDAERTATALSIAASFSSGIKANFGSYVKPLHAGHCNRNGLLAAKLAAGGYTAAETALDGPQGFLELFNGAGRYRVERALVPWFEPPAVQVPGISLKQFPCCGSTHAPIYAALELFDGGCQPDAVEQVLVEVHPRRLPHTDNPCPETALEAKFSMQYCVARVLLSGRVTPDHFEAEAIAEPAVKAMTAKVRARASERFAASPDAGFAAAVTVTGAGGDVRRAQYLRPPGRGPDNPMSNDEFAQKFMDCAARALPESTAGQALSTLTELEHCPDVRALTALLARGAAAGSGGQGGAAAAE